MVLVKHERINFESNSLSTILWNFPIYKFMQVYIWQKIKKPGEFIREIIMWQTKISIFASYYASCVCYGFSHLIRLFSVTCLFLLYKFTRFLNLFSVSLWRRANARHIILYYPYRQYTFSYFDLYFFSAFTEHYVYIWWRQVWDKNKLVR